MSKFFYKGRIEKKPKHESYGYNTKRQVKLGSRESPLSLIVASEQRVAEVQVILTEHELFASFEVDDSRDEDLSQLDGILNKPKPQTFDKTPNRNDPCPCGSGQKYKKCCGKG